MTNEPTNELKVLIDQIHGLSISSETVAHDICRHLRFQELNLSPGIANAIVSKLETAATLIRGATN